MVSAHLLCNTLSFAVFMLAVTCVAFCFAIGYVVDKLKS
jgi:hypothetical protein